MFGVSWLPPEVAAWLGTATEPFLPPLLALGLVTRFAALSLSAFNVVAVISFWHILGGNQAALNSHLYWGVLLAVTGPGKFSLDHLLWKRVLWKRSAASAP